MRTIHEARQILIDSFISNSANAINSAYDGIYKEDETKGPSVETNQFAFSVWGHTCCSSFIYIHNPENIQTFLFGNPNLLGRKHPEPQKEERRYIDWLFSEQSPWRRVINRVAPVKDDDKEDTVNINGSPMSIHSSEFHYQYGFFVENCENTSSLAFAHFYKAYRIRREYPNFISTWASLQDNVGWDAYDSFQMASILNLPIHGKSPVRNYDIYFWMPHSLFTANKCILREAKNMRNGSMAFVEGGQWTWGKQPNYLGCDNMFSGRTNTKDKMLAQDAMARLEKFGVKANMQRTLKRRTGYYINDRSLIPEAKLRECLAGIIHSRFDNEAIAA